MSRKRFLKALTRSQPSADPAYGSGTSVVCRDLMDQTGVFFPEAHLDAEKMAALAITGHSVLNFDAVMPLFSVCHEAAAMGCRVDWGGPDRMPESGPPIFASADDIHIPADLLTRPACAVPLEAITLLKKRLGDDAAVCGKVFGPWTQAYHYFGIENFLVMTLDDPDEVKRIIERLVPVTLAFAAAQIDAGADCLLLADHATRDLCSPGAYREFLASLHAQLAEQIACPLALHICGNTADRIGMIAGTGLACFHWDTKTGTPIEVRALAGEGLSLMGGISNMKLLNAPADQVAADARAAAGAVDIIGPECAIPLHTPVANLKAIVPS
jgi:MtaA/CmuA family methyltransferase